MSPPPPSSLVPLAVPPPLFKNMACEKQCVIVIDILLCTSLLPCEPLQFIVWLTPRVHRSLWLFASHLLGMKSEVAVKGGAVVGAARKSGFDAIALLMLLLKELYLKIATSNSCSSDTSQYELVVSHSNSIGDEDVSEWSTSSSSSSSALAVASVAATEELVAPRATYESLCLVILSRCMQRKDLRQFTERILISLPSLPAACVQLLELLLSTGTSPSTAATGGSAAAGGRHKRGHHQAAASPMGEKDKGTRMLAAEGLLKILEVRGASGGGGDQYHHLSLSHHAFCSVMHPLLWKTVVEDFDMRRITCQRLVR